LDIIAILGGLIMLAAIVVYVSRPLRRRTVDASGDTMTLETQREALYTQIKELDLDHATGKVNDDDYARLRADLVAQAAAVLKQLDGIALPAAASHTPVTDDVEALIAARRKTRSASAAPLAAAPPAAGAKSADADVEAAIAARRKTAAATSAAAKCPQCGKPINADDAFCAKCGAALRTQTAP
jgi:hypothetical protein